MFRDRDENRDDRRRDDRRRDTVHVVDVVRHEGPGISIPDDISVADAIDVLFRKREEEETITNFYASIEASPYDGALALSRAMEDQFGFAVASSGFGSSSNLIQVAIDAHGNTVSVPWGSFEVPGMERGKISTGYTFEDGRIVFQVEARIKRKFEPAFNRLVERVRELVATESIYRGKAFNIQFTDDHGMRIEMPEVKFMDTKKAVRPIFNAVLDETFEHDVMAWVKHPDLIRELRGTLKRGVLLAGPYGTGKTLSASYIAQQATNQGFTFIYVKPDDIPFAIDYARVYQPAVIFAEDVEKAAQSERNYVVDRLLNKLDGVDSKSDDIVCVFTTNHIENITPAMLRPGRVDVILSVEPPDAEAAIKIAKMYARGTLAEGEDFSRAGEELAGLIPAVIAEAVQRARVRAVARTQDSMALISNVDLVAAAQSVVREREAVTARKQDENPMLQVADQLGQAMGTALGTNMATAMQALGSGETVMNGHATDVAVRSS